MRFILAAALIAALAALTGTSATAAPTLSTYSVSGQRLGSSTTLLAATTSWNGALRRPGEILTWSASLTAPFGSTPTLIPPGGTFTIINGNRKGVVTDGTIVPQSPNCGTRNYAMTANIAFANGQLGHLTMNVTAYQSLSGGQCYTYVVTILNGQLTLT